MPECEESVEGFVLAGGMSRRMGRDKALLPFRGRTLIEHVAGAVREAAGSAVLVGPPERYARLGFPVVADERPGMGPLGGIVTALGVARSGWILAAACDLPGLTGPFLSEMLARWREQAGDADCFVPQSSGGVEPLCAVWRVAALPRLRCALNERRLKMKEVIGKLNARVWPVADARWFRNVNTPLDWASEHA